MHFGEMDHLPYKHSSFVPSFSMEVLQIDSFILIEFVASSCFNDVLHDLVLFLFFGTFL